MSQHIFFYVLKIKIERISKIFLLLQMKVLFLIISFKCKRVKNENTNFFLSD